MIQSINLSNSYTVPFGPGSALIKCRLITLTQMGARGTYSRAMPPFASKLEERFWCLKLEVEAGQGHPEVSPCPSLASFLLPDPPALSSRAQDSDTKRRRAFTVICSENTAEGWHPSGFEIAILLSGDTVAYSARVNMVSWRMNWGIWSLKFPSEFELCGCMMWNEQAYSLESLGLKKWEHFHE